ncbi:MAG: aminotransferase class III-fold pyridoxal phosphate-dependent enzyme [Deltaproteobacteria bacterium]|nr:aminotransferase class III-fold pyridoxal phosphate-dependent enzyme [Deltaproteobacteria bacterium]
MVDEILSELESKYCSYGDTVHYLEPPKLFQACEGGFLYDAEGTPYFDLQMQYSAANLGYRSPRLAKVLEARLRELPQLDSRYLHQERILLAERIATLTEKRFGLKGRVHFNMGGAGAVEDSLRLVRNATGKNLQFAFMGGYHGRTLGASAITSSYRYRRRYGHFGDRAHFVPYPYCFRCFYELEREDCSLYCLMQFGKLFDTEYYSFWDSKAGECEYGSFYMEPVQGTGGYIIPPRDYFAGLKKILEGRKILLVDDEIQMGFYRTGKLWAIEHFGIAPDVIVFGKALTNGLNPLSGFWAREDLISPSVWPPDSTSSTLAADPQGTAVALEVLDILRSGRYEDEVAEKGNYFLAGLRNLKKKYPRIIGDVDGLGLALRIEICRGDGKTPDPEATERILQEGLKGDLEKGGRSYGLVLDVGGYYKNVFTLAPHLDISYEEIDLGIELLDHLLGRFC